MRDGREGQPVPGDYDVEQCDLEQAEEAAFVDAVGCGRWIVRGVEGVGGRPREDRRVLGATIGLRGSGRVVIGSSDCGNSFTILSSHIDIASQRLELGVLVGRRGH